MCFTPKIKTPKADPQSIRAVDPAPLTETPKGILFGGDDEDDNKDEGITSEVPTKGRKGLKIKLDKSASQTASAKSKSSIRNAVMKSTKNK